jgi:hypothetical protein
MFGQHWLRAVLAIWGTTVVAGGCAGKTAPGSAQPRPDAVVFEDRLTVDENDDKSPLRIARIQLPAAGECRLWFPGKAVREQPPAGACAQVEPTAPPESWVLYRPRTDTRLIHVRVVDPERAGVIAKVRVYDAERGTYLGTRQRRGNPS